MSLETDQPGQTRIQKSNREAILAAALEFFSANGYRGATLDEIAQVSGLSKPNLLHYFGSKEDIHRTLLTSLLDRWLDPLRSIDPEGDPVEEIVTYVLRKLAMSREMPRESRLFAHEILRGAPGLADQIRGPLKRFVDDTAAVFAVWMENGRLTRMDPHHLIFSIWATTQHYADCEAQVQGILGAEPPPTDAAATFLETLYRRALTPSAS